MSSPDPGLVARRFRVLGLLGTGGSSVVYRAHDTVLGREVALKLSHPYADPARLRAEGRAAALVDNPHVVRAVDSGDLADGRAWIALELVEGVSLAERVARDGPLAPGEVLALAAALLDGLAAVHAAGLVHRDVSPLNVHLAPGPVATGGVWLLDLGLAGATGTVARDDATGVLGNPGYVAPEQARGDPVDARGDLYQLGGTLYLALTGRPPFGDGPAEHLLALHATEPPPVPSGERPGLPAALDRLVVRAMLKDPALRFGSAAEMRAAVVAAADAPATAPGTRVLPDAPRPVPVPFVLDEPAQAPHPEPLPPLPPPSSSRGAVLTVLLVLAAVVGIGWVSQAVADPGPPTVIAAPTATPTSTPSATPSTSPSPSPRTTRAPVLVDVPDLVGLSADEAAAALAAVGLRVGSVTPVVAPASAGTVLAASPAAGDHVAAGSGVDLQTASGRTVVPDVAGLGADAAEQAVRAAGLEPESRGTGTLGVLSTDPGAGVDVPVGSAVTLDLGDATTATATPTPTDTSAPTATAEP